MNDISKNVVTVDDVVSAYFAQGQNGGSQAQDESGNVVTISADQVQTTGTEIGGITIGNNRTAFYAPIVSVTPSLNSGTAIATINVNGVNKTLYAPANEGGSGEGGQSSGGSGSTYYPQLYYSGSISGAFSYGVVANLSITDGFYIEGVLYKAASNQAAQVSLWGNDGTNTDKILVNSLRVNSNTNTYFAIYGKRITSNGKWVCCGKTADAPTSAPNASGVQVNGSSWHALGGWDNDIGNTIAKLTLGDANGEYGKNSYFRVYGA